KMARRYDENRRLTPLLLYSTLAIIGLGGISVAFSAMFTDLPFKILFPSKSIPEPWLLVPMMTAMVLQSLILLFVNFFFISINLFSIILLLVIAVFQAIGIFLFHSSMYQVLSVLCAVGFTGFFVMFLLAGYLIKTKRIAPALREPFNNLSTS
ncbi:MAG: hypothetical protein JRI22_21775, partial [Deltaproteobacteria bacterium]|nr:hypothetical protein [Deltaproteobacteria bacterium]